MQPTGPDGRWLERLTVLAVVSGVTSRVRLGTNVLQAALRRPVVLAKSVATFDVLSGGRVDLGVGIGWQREEYEAAGLRFESVAGSSTRLSRCARGCGRRRAPRCRSGPPWLRASTPCRSRSSRAASRSG